MAQSVVGKWGKNLAVRVPMAVAQSTGITDGERVEVEQVPEGILIRRREAQAAARQRALEAVAGIKAASQHFSLGGLTIRELLEEGRRK